MNARSLARFYAALADAHPAGQRLLSAEGIQVATALQSADIDQVMGGPRNRALGYHLGEPLSPMGAGLSAFGHDGAGGSIGFADPQHRFAFGLAKTRMVFAPPEEEAAYLVAREIRRVVGIPEAG